jgi:hypothetical protein
MHSEDNNKETNTYKNFLPIGTDFFRGGMNEARANRNGDTCKSKNKNT